MIHDEPTTEIELPWLARKGEPIQKVVKVDFEKNKKTAVIAKPKSQSWIQEFDVQSPWVFRLLLVTVILLLSMLVL